MSFEIARRHRFAREMAELPDDVEVHVLPDRGHLEPATTRSSRYRDFRRRAGQIDATYEAGLAYLELGTLDATADAD